MVTTGLGFRRRVAWQSHRLDNLWVFFAGIRHRHRRLAEEGREGWESETYSGSRPTRPGNMLPLFCHRSERSNGAAGWAARRYQRVGAAPVRMDKLRAWTYIRPEMEGATLMNASKYVASIERQIREHQRVQASNPPSSEAWQNASTEINRLAALIVDVTKGRTLIHSGSVISRIRYADGSSGAIRNSRLGKA